MKSYITQSLNDKGEAINIVGKVYFDKDRTVNALVKTYDGISVNTENWPDNESTIVYVKLSNGAELRFIIKEIETEPLSITVEDIIRKETFPISCLSREDLEEKGFDSKKISDRLMERLAKKLGDDYCEQLFWTSLEIIAESEDCPVLSSSDLSDEEKVKAYIERFGGESGVLELEDGPSWTFYDDENNGYTDTAVKLAVAEDDTVDVLWEGERNGKDLWEKLTDKPNDNDTESFIECLVEALEEEFGEL